MKRLTLILLTAILLAGISTHATLRYVKPGQPGTAPYQSWSLASDNLQAVINASEDGDTIWVAAGTYLPTHVPVYGSCFVPKEGVRIYGGFTGNETSFEARDWKTNVCTLKADDRMVIYNHNLSASTILDGFTITGAHTNDGAGIFNNNASVLINNCLFTGNTATSMGGGMYNINSSPGLNNCVFYNNSSGGYGAGMVNTSSSPTLSNCIFYNNATAGTGGALFNDASSVAIYNCTFYGNSAGTSGGGISSHSATLNMSNSIIWGNTAPQDPDFFNSLNTTASINYSNVPGYTATGTGNKSANPLFVHSGNPQGQDGVWGTADDGLRLFYGSPSLDAGDAQTNDAGYGIQVSPFDITGAVRIQSGRIDMGAYEGGACATFNVLYVDSSVAVPGLGDSWASAYNSLAEAVKVADACPGIDTILIARGTYYPEYVPYDLSTNDPRDKAFVFRRDKLVLLGGYPNGGGTRNWETNPVVLDGHPGAEQAYHLVLCVGTAAAPLAATLVFNGLQLRHGNANGSGTIDFNETPIPRNSGAAFYNHEAAPLIQNVVFAGNSATGDGGALCNALNSAPVISNVAFTGNSAHSGGAVYNTATGAAPRLINVTFSGNNALQYGGALYNGSEAPFIANSILWNNNADLSGPEIFNAGAAATMKHSIVRGGYSDGTDIIDQDPLWVAEISYTMAPFTGGNYQLSTCSPAIDAGDTTGISVYLPDTDLSAGSRYLGTGIDIGAYERNATVNNVIYVDSSIAIAGDGSSWAKAFKSLAEAVKLADNCAVVDTIVIARGTYYPQYVPYNVPGASARDKAFTFRRDHLVLLGGYPGGGSTTRDPEANPVRLNGDPGADGKVFHVLLVAGTGTTPLDNTLVFDGLHIINGSADGGGSLAFNGHTIYNNQGGALYNLYAAPAIRDCYFSNNQALVAAGAIYNNHASPRISNCMFQGNQVTGEPGKPSFGGALYNEQASPVISGCTFTANQVLHADDVAYGGAMANREGTATIINCRFSGNLAGAATSYGGAIANTDGASSTIYNSTLSGNKAVTGGFLYNHAQSNTSILKNSIVWGNSSPAMNNDNADIEYSIVQGGYNGTGNIGADPLFIHAPSYSTAPFEQGNYQVQAGSPAINTGGPDTSGLHLPDTDLGGNGRLQNGRVDIGAYESAYKRIQPDEMGILYVDKNATGSKQSGNTWSDAVTELAYALKAAKTMNEVTADSVKQIWVAKGTYKPLYTPEDNQNFADSSVLGADHILRSFLLVKDVKIYGGFDPAHNITDLEDPRILPGSAGEGSVLSGDYLGDDQVIATTSNLTFVHYEDNACQVVVSAGDAGNALLDGFTIRGGFARKVDTVIVNGVAVIRRYGGGLYTGSSSPGLHNMFFYANGGVDGGAIHSAHATGLRVVNSRFTANWATYGAAIFNNESTCMITQAVFEGNWTAIAGGAVYNSYSPSTQFVQATFSGNKSNEGGALYNRGTSPVLTNVLFSGNKANTGAAVYNFDQSLPSVINSVFSGNHASGSGGAVFNDNLSSATLSNSIIWGNSSAIFNTGTAATVNYSMVQGNYAGLHNKDTDPLFFNAPSAANAPFIGGNYRLQPGSPAIDAGTPDTTGLYLPATDLAGNPRYQGAAIDIGAYEVENDAVVYTVLYVDSSVTANGDGRSWGTAYKSLADAVKFADEYPTVHTLYIAKGTYYPAHVPYGIITADPKYKTFTFRRDNLALRGGYPSGGSATPDSEHNPVLLSGDIGTPGDTSDNVYHIVVIAGTAAAPVGTTLVLEGLTFKNGNAGNHDSLDFYGSFIHNGSGGAMYNLYASPTISNCTFSGNFAAVSGGAMQNNNMSAPAITHCAFLKNYAQSRGGAMANVSSAPSIANSAFSQNEARRGGAINNQAASAPTIDSCSFISNKSDYGGALYNLDYSSPLIRNSIFDENVSEYGGAISNLTASSPLIENCTFSGNRVSAYGGGGAVYNLDASPKFINCVISGGQAYYGGAMYNTVSSAPVIRNCVISGNTAISGYAGALYNYDHSMPSVINSIIHGNSSGIGNSDALSSVAITYSQVQGEPADAATGNLNGDTDPLFVHAPSYTTAPFTGGDYRLQKCAPAINAGSPDTTGLHLPVIDLDGLPRVYGGRIDMGAYEYQVAHTHGGILYVKKGSSGSGYSWECAIGELGDALNQASRDPSIGQIWVAGGTYKPNTVIPHIDVVGAAIGDRDQTFFIPDGVALYGGFSGTETTLGEREIATHITTLSGDIGIENDASDNCYHVVVAAVDGMTGRGVTVDGFTITGGNASESYADYVFTPEYNDIDRGSGGGVFAYFGNSTLRNNIIEGNYAAAFGAGVNANYCTIGLINNIISGNQTPESGGGINANYALTTISNNTISGNDAGQGGGYFQTDGSSSFSNNIFWGNRQQGSATTAGADYTGNGAKVFKHNLLQLPETAYTGSQDLGSNADGNLFEQNPLFTDAPSANAPFNGGDYRLLPCSPAINAGGPDTAGLQLSEADLDGNNRISGTAIDIGAYEFRYDPYTDPRDTFDLAICAHQLPYSFGPLNLNTTGFYTENFPTHDGCDSTVTLNFRVKDTFIVTTALTLCATELPYRFGTQNLTATGTYTEIFSSQEDCDSTVTLNLQVSDTFVVADEAVLCFTALPYVFGTQTLTAAGTYTEVFRAQNGCDSTVTLSLQVKDTFIVNDAASVCAGDLPYAFGAQNLTLPGTYKELFTAQNGCDSTVTLTLQVRDTFVSTQAVTLCADLLPYLFGAQSLTAPGTYTEVFAGGNGCDSTVTLTLWVKDTFIVDDAAAICADELPYVFGTQNLNATGVYTERFQAQNGCDSTVTLRLQVKDTFIVNDALVVCSSDLPYVFGSRNLNAAGIYTERFGSSAGCDSTVTLTLQVNDAFSVTEEIAICANQLPYIFGTLNITTPGTYTQMFTSRNGCDSTVTLTLQVNDTFVTNGGITVCAGDLPYAFGAQSLTLPGTYTEVFATQKGCDSTVTLTLQVRDTFMVNDAAIICADQAPYTFGTQNLRATGTYTEVFSARNGCDSTVTLALQVNDTFIVKANLAICTEDFPYAFGNQVLTSVGVYTQTFSTVNGCDSTVTLHLSMRQPRIHYVRSIASGLADGSSWANAGNDLQYAINNACAGDSIFVASGTYLPVRPVYDLNSIVPLSPDNAFVLKKEVPVFGGFEGKENTLSDRTLSAPASVLSGDLDQSGTMNAYDAFHVVVAADAAGNTVIDGFRISGGHARGNSEQYYKGTALNSGNGGGIYIHGASVAASNITLSGNAAYGNDHAGNGAAAYLSGNGVLHLSNALLTGNKAAGYGGAVYHAEHTSSALLQVTLAGNDARQGGALYAGYGSDITMNNSILYGNSDAVTGSGSLTAAYSTIQEPYPGQGNLRDNPLFVDALPPAMAPTTEGNYNLQQCSPAISSGNSSLLHPFLTMDIAGNERIQGREVDRGAYENAGFALSHIAGDSLSANASCIDDEGWVHLYHDTEEKIILSLHFQGQSSGDLTATTWLNKLYGSHTITPLFQPFGQNINLYPVNRSWIVNSDSQPAQPVKIRFYFSATDLEELKASYPFTSKEALLVYKVAGNNAWAETAQGYTAYTRGDSGTQQHYIFGTYQGLEYVEFEVNSFSSGSIALPSSLPLGMLLLSFDGLWKNDKVYLAWRTAKEEQMDYFQVERSEDARTWEPLQQQQASNRPANAYALWDGNPGSVNYYRLLMVDKDGQRNYSKVIQLNRPAGQKGSVSIYPNPNQGTFVVMLKDINSGQAELQIFDVLGRRVHSQQVFTGSTPVSLPGIISKGIYTIRVTTPDLEYNQKVVIDRN